jgi:CRISPR-associated exonuclease Cas4
MVLLGVAFATLLIGFILVWWASHSRELRGLGAGKTVALDDLTLYSERLKLAGRPDRIVRQGEHLIPEEWKPSAKRAHPGARLQIGAYLLLIEEEYGERPPFGVVVLGDGSRVQVENTEALSSEVLAIAEKIREHRARVAEEIPVRQPAWGCRACGQRDNCRQVRE